jgi:hypothetical protein
MLDISNPTTNVNQQNAQSSIIIAVPHDELPCELLDELSESIEPAEHNNVRDDVVENQFRHAVFLQEHEYDD